MAAFEIAPFFEIQSVKRPPVNELSVWGVDMSSSQTKMASFTQRLNSANSSYQERVLVRSIICGHSIAAWNDHCVRSD